MAAVGKVGDKSERYRRRCPTVRYSLDKDEKSTSSLGRGTCSNNDLVLDTTSMLVVGLANEEQRAVFPTPNVFYKAKNHIQAEL